MSSAVVTVTTGLPLDHCCMPLGLGRLLLLHPPLEELEITHRLGVRWLICSSSRGRVRDRRVQRDRIQRARAIYGPAKFWKTTREALSVKS